MQSTDNQYDQMSKIQYFPKIEKNVQYFFYLFRRQFEGQNRKANVNIITQSPCPTFPSGIHEIRKKNTFILK